MNQLPYLVREICAGVEVYFTGQTGGQYLNTAYILCDNYTELTAKLFLLVNDPHWSDSHSSGRFKKYQEIQREVETVLDAECRAELPRIRELHSEMEVRHRRRNNFFHSTTLLDLNVKHEGCVDSYCDLMDYGALLFGEEWAQQVSTARNLETFEIILRLYKHACSQPSIAPKVNAILRDWPRNITGKLRGRGVQVAEHPADIHLRMCVINGGPELLAKLQGLLDECSQAAVSS